MPLTHEVVAEIMSECGWRSIDDLAAEIKRRDILDARWFEGVHDRALKADLRSLLREKGPDGWPMYANVTTVSADGEELRIYKQEALFDAEDYQEVINYHSGRANYHFKVARVYQDHAFERFHVQIPLPLEGFGPRIAPVPV